MLYANTTAQNNSVSNITTNTTSCEHAHSLLQQFLMQNKHIKASLNDNSEVFEFTFTPADNTRLFVCDSMCNVPVEHIILSPTHVTTKTLWHDGTDYISTLPVEAYGKHNDMIGCRIVIDTTE